MAAQTTYGFNTPKGVPGGLYDISYHEVNTRMNEEEDGKLGFGVGVVYGTTKGHTVKLPVAASTADQFEGVTIYGVTVEHDMTGTVVIRKNTTVGVVRTGKVWAKVAAGIEPVYNAKLYLIKNGSEAGCFTNVSGADTIEIKGKFIGEVDNGIAPILLPDEVN